MSVIRSDLKVAQGWAAFKWQGSGSDPFFGVHGIGQGFLQGTVGTRGQQPILGVTAWDRLQMETESVLKLAHKEATVKLP